VVVRWNDAALEAIRRVRPAPTVAARALAVLHTCVYEAWAAYDPVAVGTQTGDALRQPAARRTPESKAEAVGYAARRALADLFPGEAALFADVLAGAGYDPAAGPAAAGTPRGVGEAAARAVLDFRHADGANQLGDLVAGAGPYADTTGYAPVNDPDRLVDPGRWQPLRVPDGRGGASVQRCATPHWGLVAPFALATGHQLRPADWPPAYPSAAYRAQAVQLLEYSAGLTDAHKAIAEYWADGPASETPPGHWCLFAQWVSRRDGHDLDADAVLFFALANALLDASIACWDCKLAVDYVRPVSAVRFLFGGRPVRAWAGPGRGTGTIDGASWAPYRPATEVTPPFPEYVSGHSTFSAAAAEVLRRSTGGDDFGAGYTVRAGESQIEPGVTPAADVGLHWNTFTEAADQAGLSRRYGGIHFEAGDLTGRAMGRLVGAQAWERAQAYVTGSG
jgi:hypothetical protein